MSLRRVEPWERAAAGIEEEEDTIRPAAGYFVGYSLSVLIDLWLMRWVWA